MGGKKRKSNRLSLSLSLGRAELASKMKETHATRTEHDIVRFQDRIIELRVASWEARRGEARGATRRERTWEV